jgi:uncharacterized protein YjbJ (UPF0337 family)
MEIFMNWDRVEGNWKEVEGQAKQQWRKITNDNLIIIKGCCEDLESNLQEHYGYAKDKVKAEVDSWLGNM